MEKRRDLFRRVKEHRKIHTTCKIKLKGDTNAIEKHLSACEGSIGPPGPQSDYRRWLNDEHIRLLELLNLDFPNINTPEDLEEKNDEIARHVRKKMDDYTLSEEEGDSYFTFFYPLTKYFFHTVKYRKELKDRYKAAFPNYDELGEGDELPLGIWRFTLREMISLGMEGISDTDIVALLREDCGDLFEEMMVPLCMEPPLAEKEPLSAERKIVLIAKTELISLFMGLLSCDVKIEFARLPETRISEFPWGLTELKKLLSIGILLPDKVSMLPELWFKTKYQSSEDRVFENISFIPYNVGADLKGRAPGTLVLIAELKIQLSRCLKRRDEPNIRKTAMNILNLTWRDPNTNIEGQRLEIDSYDHELLHQMGALVFLSYTPTKQKEFAELIDLKVAKSDKNDLKHLFGMQDTLKKHTLALRESESLSLCLSIIRMGAFDLIEKMTFQQDIRNDFRFISALAGLKDTARAFGYIKKQGIDINGGSGMLLRSCCKYIKSAERRASFKALMLDPDLLVNLKTRSNPQHALLYLLEATRIEQLLATDAIKLFVDGGLLLSKQELAEALKLLQEVTYGLDVQTNEFQGLKENLKAYRAVRYSHGDGKYKVIAAMKSKWGELLVNSQRKNK